MSSLFMGAINYGPVPADEKAVRNTATPVDDDKPAAMAEDMPEQQEFESDPDPSLGMSSRQLASKWSEGQHANASAWSSDVAETSLSTTLINQQVSTSGTAADRELAGQTHKNLSYAIGIEPVQDLADINHKMGNTYFVRNERVVQEGITNSMSVPPGQDHSAVPGIAMYGKDAARDAYQSNLYNAFWNGGN